MFCEFKYLRLNLKNNEDKNMNKICMSSYIYCMSYNWM